MVINHMIESVAHRLLDSDKEFATLFQSHNSLSGILWVSELLH